MKRTLKDLFVEHTGKLTDKWSLYIDVWESLFSPFREQAINMLEIGVHNGGSLEIWSKYFEDAQHIIGCDINEVCAKLVYENPNISVIIGDINSDSIENKIKSKNIEFDFIIDDGSHRSGEIIESFARYFKYLKTHGFYIIEDLHSSYWDTYQGGLNNPYSSMSFLKHLSDIINHEHWRVDQTRKMYLSPFEDYYHITFEEYDLECIHSMKCLNSLCIIQKAFPSENKLGERIIVGNDELITEQFKRLNRTSINQVAKNHKDSSDLRLFQLIDKIAEQKQTIHKHVETIQTLKLNVSRLDNETQQLEKRLEHQKEIILQNESALDDKENFIEELMSIKVESDKYIQQIKTELVEREQEVLFYALSRSWRLTRPLRKIRKFFRRLLNNNE